MDLLPDEAQQEIIAQTAAFLDEAMPIERLRTRDKTAGRPDDATWSQIAELGWFGLAIDEAKGGVGFSLVEEALLFREVGRHVGSVSLLATSLAAHVAAAAGEDALLAALIAGEKRVGWASPSTPPSPLSAASSNGAADLGSSITGRFQVFDGEPADLWLAVDERAAVLIDPSSAVRTDPKRCLDEFSALNHAELENVTTVALARADAVLFDRAAVLSAAMLVGLAEAARDQGAAYAKTRVQFGKPIGVFQAIKHPCADMAVRCEAAWSQTCYAALALRDGLGDAAFQVSAAKSLAGDAATENAAANLQIHGGYGFTTEYDAHTLVKRAHILNALAGTPRMHRRRVLDAPLAA
jgi:alkylation response protein AidB-like acyl-CoA dehydrogenase